jgi:hypothetical protein
MSMVVQQRPCIAWSGALQEDSTKPIEKQIAIIIIAKNDRFLDTSDHHVVERPWRIYS